MVLNGQVTILVLAAFWAGWLALERQRPFLAGLAFGLLLVKPQFAIPLAVAVVACRDFAMMKGALVSIALQVAIVARVLGWSVLKAFGEVLPLMMQHADSLEPKSFQSHSLRTLTRLAPPWIGVPLWGVLCSSADLGRRGVEDERTGPRPARHGDAGVSPREPSPHRLRRDRARAAHPVVGRVRAGARVTGRCHRVLDFRVWLFVSFLVPTAAAIGVQLSVLLMGWLVVLIARTAGAFNSSTALRTHRQFGNGRSKHRRAKARAASSQCRPSITAGPNAPPPIA